MNNTNSTRGFTIIASLQTATLQSNFSQADLRRLPTNLKRIQVCEALKPEAFKLLNQYLHSYPDTELRLFSVLAAKSCFDDLWPLAHLSGLKKLAIELVHLNSVERLIPLADSLQSLAIGPARRKNLDLSWFGHAIKLESLAIDGQTRTGSVLHQLPRLRVLRLANLNFADDFKVCDKLEQVELTKCKFESLQWLYKLKKLRYLKLDKVANSLKDLRPGMLPRSLKALWLHDLLNIDLNGLTSLKSLEAVKLSKLPGTLELAVVKKLPQLSQLVLEKVHLGPFNDPPAALVKRLTRLVIDSATLKSSDIKATELGKQFPQLEVRQHATLANWP